MKYYIIWGPKQMEWMHFKSYEDFHEFCNIWNLNEDNVVIQQV